MATTDESCLAQLPEEFIARCRAGEMPHWQEYADDHPQIAVEIKELFPLMQCIDGVVGSARTDTQHGNDGNTNVALNRATIGGFRILRPLGQGGMGAVFEAEKPSLRRHVAVKALSRSIELGGTAEQRFRQEATAAA